MRTLSILSRDSITGEDIQNHGLHKYIHKCGKNIL